MKRDQELEAFLAAARHCMHIIEAHSLGDYFDKSHEIIVEHCTQNVTKPMKVKCYVKL